MSFEEPKPNDPIKEYLNNIDPMNTTPIEALNNIITLKEMINKN